ncbi:tRNA dihydrouridine synthase [Planctomicrobium sp. SH664]|uniref:tRNA dihydrouridine synthase n=1 Tax=Planctomicrobium sp. SH664 TaxID=3448125 RepID=UPI003F5B62B7
MPSTSFRIGAVELPHPFVQAALSGYSDWPMRALARNYGAAYTVAEVMIDRFVNEVRGTGKTAHHLYVAEEDHPVGAQLMGSDPEQFPPAATRLVQAGFDVIDINFGCPVKSAIGGCRGGYHLSQPLVALEIVSRVRDAVPADIPVTLKMRRGIDDSPESRDRFYEILDGAFARGVAAITVHGRTVVQKYVGPSNWDFLREVKQYVGDRTILGSGDLFTAEDCVAMLRQTGVNGVTIARGAIGNPWIFRQALALWRGETPLAPPSVAEQRAGLLEHLGLIARLHGEERAPALLRRFAFQYAHRHPQLEELRVAFSGVRTPQDFSQLLDRFYC